ncbi:Heat-inducible transcription repressor HrcA [hydrothermal vent metagenome]|uniref:Heat-inducible transcription repressor HrcA n=1 Tax=hydrothermal vent metagenome TaxID=652676 RepID=A0A3B1A8M2_9ZZZZ
MPDPSELSESGISDRAQYLLKSLVEHYIADGQPVGSRVLAKDSGIKLSPATVRNVMSDLEDLGLITAPHTSSGRIPTVQGYRLFIDNLLTIKPLGTEQIKQFKSQLEGQPSSSGVPSSEKLIETASGMLSAVTKMAGIVMLPKHEKVILKHIEFLILSTSSVLVIMVVNNEEVINKVINTQREYSSVELQQTANFLNQEYAGHELESIRSSLYKGMQDVREDMHRIMQTAVEMADQVIDKNKDSDFILAGETNLMQYNEMGDVDKLRQLFEAFNTKQDVLHLLDNSIHADGMQIFIGEESGYSAFGECSVVTSPYTVDDQVVGVLGVIGPTRMAYDKVIPIVDVTAKLLGSVLTSE